MFLHYPEIVQVVIAQSLYPDSRIAGRCPHYQRTIYHSPVVLDYQRYWHRERKKKMSDSIYERETIRRIVKPIAEKYRIQNVYLFGSYARGEATYSSDLDCLVYVGEQIKRTMIFAFAEELRKALEKNVDVFEINEINENSDFYHTIMRERVLVA